MNRMYKKRKRWTFELLMLDKELERNIVNKKRSFYRRMKKFVSRFIKASFFLITYLST